MKNFRIVIVCLLWWFILTPWGYANQIDLKIFYVNDFHGFAEPYQPTGSASPLGGIAYLAGAVERAGKTTIIIIVRGGYGPGECRGQSFPGKSTIEVMNVMRFDAMVVGNHEFDFGPTVLKERVAQARFPIFGANVRGLPALLKPYIIKNLSGAPVIASSAKPPGHPRRHPSPECGGTDLSTPEIVKQYLPELKGRADIIVVLSHCGFQADRELAARVPAIDVIIGRPLPYKDDPAGAGGPDNYRPGLGTRQGPGGY